MNTDSAIKIYMMLLDGNVSKQENVFTVFYLLLTFWKAEKPLYKYEYKWKYKYDEQCCGKISCVLEWIVQHQSEQVATCGSSVALLRQFLLYVQNPWPEKVTGFYSYLVWSRPTSSKIIMIACLVKIKKYKNKRDLGGGGTFGMYIYLNVQAYVI